MISNSNAIIFEYHQFLFRFWYEVCLLLSDIRIREKYVPSVTAKHVIYVLFVCLLLSPFWCLTLVHQSLVFVIFPFIVYYCTCYFCYQFVKLREFTSFFFFFSKNYLGQRFYSTMFQVFKAVKLNFVKSSTQLRKISFVFSVPFFSFCWLLISQAPFLSSSTFFVYI